MLLSAYTDGKDNNFNLIRIIVAFAVVVTHSYTVVIGHSYIDPLKTLSGLTLGSVAVDIFFILSGFLVTRSLLTRTNIVDFFWARVLRIYPALIVMVLLTVLLLGPYFTSLSLTAYFTNSTTYKYLAKCATLFTGIAYELPGVFENNPAKHTVNASLWTMPREIKVYSILAGIWLVLNLTGRHRAIMLKIVLIGCVLYSGAQVIERQFQTASEGQYLRLFFMFFSGASLYVFKEKIPLSRLILGAFVAVLAVALAFNKKLFFVSYLLFIPYIILALAFLPRGLIRSYNRLGDYSYGLYIYSFPIQQSVAALIPGVSVLQMLVLSSVSSLAMAMLSWHLIEQRALGLKTAAASNTTRFIEQGRARWAALRP